MNSQIRSRTAVVFVLILFAADVTSGLVPGWLEDEVPEPVPDIDLSRAYDEAERRFEGGGPLVLFYDDMDAATAAHYEALDGFEGDYYGGAALADEEEGAARWSQELLRWGASAVAGNPTPGWTHESGLWRFGEDVDGVPAYVGGTLSELVTPVIDLRSVEPVEAPPVRAGTGRENPTPECNPALVPDCTTYNATVSAYPGSRFEAEAPIVDVAAAARFVHAYDFDAAFQASDGGRVEVAWFDDAKGAWSEWVGIEPTASKLRIGNGVDARIMQGGSLYEAGLKHGSDPQEVPATDVFAGGAVEASTDHDGQSQAAVGADVDPRATPYIYREEVASSGWDGDPWRGFTRQSSGPVVSVVDLTEYAGSLVRMRFVASTAAPFADDQDLVFGNAGWMIDNLEVHGSGRDGIDILGLAVPGDGSVLAPGTSVEPRVAIHNRGHEPRMVDLTAAIADAAYSDQAEIMVGPFARTLVPISAGAVVMESGLHRVSVQATARERDAPGPEPGAIPYEEMDVFHLVVGKGARPLWGITDAVARPLIESEDGIHEGFGRFVNRGQDVRIRLILENHDSVPHEVTTGTVEADDALAALDNDWDLAAIVVDADGNRYGTAKAQQKSVDLGVARSISGTMASGGAVQEAVWEWDGTEIARALDVVIINGTGHQVASAGRILVETASPAPLDIDFRNPWLWDPSSCPLLDGWQGRRGVFHCSNEAPPIITPSSRVLALDFDRSNLTSIALTYLGGPIEASLEANLSAAPVGNPPADAVWEEIHNVTFPATEEWTTMRIPFGQVSGEPGWLRVALDSPLDFSLDRASFDLNVQAPTGPATIPFVIADFDALIEEAEPVIQATSQTGLVVLDGKLRTVRDRTQGAASAYGGVESQMPECPDFGNPSVNSLVRNRCYELQPAPGHFLRTGEFQGEYVLDSISIDNGDVKFQCERLLLNCGFSIVSAGAGTRGVWTGRLVEDAILMPDNVIDLAGIGRPVLSFRDWHDTGFHAVGFVEAAVVPRDVWDQDSLNFTPAAEHWRPRIDGDDWQVLATVRGTSPVRETQPVQISLDDYVGEQVLIRFRFHTEATIQAEDRAVPGAGWAIEGVRVDGWGASGPATPHQAGEGFTGYMARGALHAQAGFQYAEQDFDWSYQFGTGLTSNQAETPLVSDPMDIDAMLAPVFELEHSGSWVCYAPAVDLEYQFRNDDGTWPTTWHRATPHGPGEAYPSYTGGPQFGPGEGNPPPLLDPATNRPNGGPFTGDADCGRSTIRAFEDSSHAFDLAPLQGKGQVRFRLVPLDDPITAIRDWTIHSVRVGELRHIVDAGIGAVTSPEDGRTQLQAKAPSVATALGLTDEIVLGNDLATVAVNTTNPGAVPVRIEVSLEAASADRADADPIELTWIRVDGNRRITTGLTAGTIELDPGQSEDVLFRVVMNDQPPGRYRFSARATVLDGVDTNTRNDVATQFVVVAPVRDLTMAVQDSRVQPFATGATDPRDVIVTLVNDGNVQERNLTLRGEVVEMTGLYSFRSFDPPIELPNHTHIDLPGRGNAVERLWRIDETTLGGLDAEAIFKPGHKYAVVVDVAAESDSIVQWWQPRKGAPLVEAPQGPLENISRVPVDSCGCMLLPFLAEKRLYETDFTARNSTTVLEESFPLETDEDVLGGWTHSLTVEGAVAREDERKDLPRWEVVDAKAVGADIDGEETGNVWRLEPYQGRERLRHELVSPILPTHVVQSLSRDVLSMRYQSDVDADHVVLENRRLIGGEWTDWVPVDELRSQRVAVVVSPDFPHFIASGYSNVANSYNTGLPGHPPAPFYTNPGDRPYIDPSQGTCHNPGACYWSAPPDFDSSLNNVWVQTLNQTLMSLASRYGSSNVAIFTTLSEDLGIGEDVGYLAHSVLDPEGRDVQFPIRSLDDLGLRLDSYGAIVLMGDNTTTTFGNESPTLAGMAHQPDDWGWQDQEADPIGIKHHRDLFAILRAAPESGIPVIATAGPASVTLARSGMADGALVTAWQAAPTMPHPSKYWNHFFYLRCAGPTEPTDPQPQPRQNCPGDSDQSTADRGQYYYMSPYDAQSYVIRDLLAANGAQLAHADVTISIAGTFVSPQGYAPPRSQGCGFQGPYQRHPGPLQRVPGSLESMRCQSFAPNIHTVMPSGLHIISAAQYGDVGAMLADVMQLLDQNTGSLPATGSSWSELPTRLAFPIGGTFWRDDQGIDRFDGAPTQLRIVVESDEELGGHGGFMLDRIGVMGTPRDKGIGVRFVEPTTDQSFAPKAPFIPKLEFTNRGTTRTSSAEAVLSMQQWIRDVPNECEVPTPKPMTVKVDAMEAGEVREVRIEPPDYPNGFNGGFFPHGVSCPAPSLMDTAFNFTLSMVYAQDNLDFWKANGKGLPQDDDPLDDVAQVTAFGREIADAVTLEKVTVTPSEAPFEEADEITVTALVANRGTQAQPVRVDLSLAYARPMVCDKGTFRFSGCDRQNTLMAPISLNQPPKTVGVASGGTAVVTYTLPVSELGDDGIGPGIYALTVSGLTFDSSNNPLPLVPVNRWIHLAADPDIETARTLHPHDGAFATDFTNLSHLTALRTTPPPSQQGGSYASIGLPDPSGFIVDAPPWPSASGAQRNHNGLFGPDQATRDGNGNPLSHGWQIASGCIGEVCPHEAVKTIAEWRRSPSPSFREGTDPASWDQSGPPGGVTTTGDEAQNGFQDFGPDALWWHPHDVTDFDRDEQAGQRLPYLSLASYEAPVLSFLTRFEAPPNTGYVVQMQLATRQCQSNPTTGVTCNNPSGWTWNTNWATLAPLDVASTAGGSVSPVTSTTRSVGGCNAGLPTCQQIPTWTRNRPSNPMAGQAGIWGQSSGLHAEDRGWQRVHVPINMAALQSYCATAAVGAFGPADPCRYADPNGGTSGSAQVARPVRFRFVAASYGGDVGDAYWQIADVSLTDHRIGFVGPDTLSVSMEDNETRDVVLRVQNFGAVNDVVRMSVSPPVGREAIFPGRGDVGLSLHPSFTDAGKTLEFPLEPGESKVVWVRIKTAIYEHLYPGSTTPIPVRVNLESVRVPQVDDQLLIDASFEAKAWPDLKAQSLLLDEDNTNGPFQTAEKVPVNPFLVVRNVGKLPVGGGSPLAVRLVQWEVDETTDQVIPGSDQIIETTTWEEAIEPYTGRGGDVFIPFSEWSPPAIGKYRLVAEINPLEDSPTLPQPELTYANNQAERLVAAGPVNFADLQITDVWPVAFDNGCTDKRVDRAISGHAYCIAAAIENRGRQGALVPRVAFGVKGGAPFSSGAPPLYERFDDGVFPGLDEETGVERVVVTSSPRVLTLKPDGTNAWEFYVDVTSQSVFPNFDNKTRELRVLVDEFDLVAEDVPDHVAIAPGEEVRLRFNVTNKGTAPITPSGVVIGDQGMLRMHLAQPPTIVPGEKVQVVLAATAAQAAQNDPERLPRMILSAKQDPFVEFPLPITFEIVSTAHVGAQAIPTEAGPGPLALPVLLDGSQSPVPLQWRIENVTAPLEIASPIGGIATVAYGAKVHEINVTVADHTPPGHYAGMILLSAGSDGVDRIVNVPMEIDVVARPELRATMAQADLHVLRAQPALFETLVENLGNVPLKVTMTHDSEPGRLSGANETFVLDPGAQRQVIARVIGGETDRVLGRTEVRWDPAAPDAPASLELPWTAHYTDARVKIVDMDLRPRGVPADSVTNAQVRLHNPTQATVEAVVSAYVDGTLHGRASVELQANQSTQVSVPYRTGLKDEPQTLLLIAHPAGATEDLEAAAFHRAGDSRSVEIIPSEDAWAIPAAGPSMLLMSIGALIAMRRRRN